MGYRREYCNGLGRATCSYGEVSPQLFNSSARRKWHREHKLVIREALQLFIVPELGTDMADEEVSAKTKTIIGGDHGNI